MKENKEIKEIKEINTDHLNQTKLQETIKKMDGIFTTAERYTNIIRSTNGHLFNDLFSMTVTPENKKELMAWYIFKHNSNTVRNEIIQDYIIETQNKLQELRKEWEILWDIVITQSEPE